MNPKIPPKVGENQHGVEKPKLIRRKRKRTFDKDKRTDAREESQERKNKRSKLARKKKKSNKGEKIEMFKVEFRPLEEGERPKTPNKKKILDKKFTELKLPAASNIQESNKIFVVNRIGNQLLDSPIKEARENLAKSKPDSLKEISKMIFNKYRTKRNIIIPAEPFRIYVENMGHYDHEKALQTCNTINYHKPSVAVILETDGFYHKGYVTYVHPDSKQKMLIMVRRDLLHAVQIFQYKKFPMIKITDTIFCVVHSLLKEEQHITLPHMDGRIVYLGDFNISSTSMAPNSNLKNIIMQADNISLEATWEVGYIGLGVQGGGIFIDQNKRDHQALIYAADFQEPERKLIPFASRIKEATYRIIRDQMEEGKYEPFNRSINKKRNLMMRAKPTFSHNWSLETIKNPPKVYERIKSTTTPFINASEVKTEILEDLKNYFQRFKPLRPEINFTEEDYKVGLYMFEYFLTRKNQHLAHSKARDRNGISYYDIFDAVQRIKEEVIVKQGNEKQKIYTKRMFDFFWTQFTKMRFTTTKCFLNRKRPIINKHNDLRMLSIQESMFKFIETIFQPITWICNYISIQNVPGTFGFISGGATWNAFVAYCPQIKDYKGKTIKQNLRPEVIEEKELDDYLEKLDEQLVKKERLKDKYDPTEFYLTQRKTLDMQ